MKTYLFFKLLLCVLFFSCITSHTNAQTRLKLTDVADIDENGWIKMKPNMNIATEEFFPLFGKDLGLTSDDEMVLFKEEEDKYGMKHYRYQQYYKKLPVENGIFIIHCKNKAIISANGHVVEQLSIDILSKQNEKNALQIALHNLGEQKYFWQVKGIQEAENFFNTNSQYPRDIPKGNVIIMNNEETGKPTLVYHFIIYFFDKNYNLDGYRVYIDANTNRVLKKVAIKHNCLSETACTKQCRYPTVPIKTMGQTISYICGYTCCGSFWGVCYCFTPKYCNYTVSTLRDDCQGDEILSVNTNNSPIVTAGSGTYWGCSWSNNTTPHWAAKQSYNYFNNVYGQQGFHNSGGSLLTIKATSNYVNASAGSINLPWLSLPYLGFMEVGYDPNGIWTFATLDVVGHEYTHLLTNNTANLDYEKESGALNESFSDIFGTMTEYYTLGNNGNYDIGEDIDYCNANSGFTALRSMSNPKLYGQPDTYLGTYWDNVVGCIPNANTNDMCGVHTNSGVQNFWFYLLAEGSSLTDGINDLGNNYCVIGIGKEKAAAIAYRNLTTYLTSLSGYYDARAGSIQAAIDLYGANSFEVAQVISAWYAVGVGSNYSAYSPFVSFNNKDFSNLNYGTGNNDYRLYSGIEFGANVYALGSNYGYATDIHFSSEQYIDFLANGWMHFEDASMFEIAPAYCPNGTNGAKMMSNANSSSPPLLSYNLLSQSYNIKGELNKEEIEAETEQIPKSIDGYFLKSEDAEIPPAISWDGTLSVIYEISDSKGVILHKSNLFKDFEEGRIYLEEVIKKLPKGSYILTSHIGKWENKQTFTK